MSNHTPGPWFIRAFNDGWRVEHSDNEVRSIIANVNGFYLAPEHGGDALHNARLIAAAPDLLAALERIAQMSYADQAADAIDAARAAVAKARGES